MESLALEMGEGYWSVWYSKNCRRYPRKWIFQCKLITNSKSLSATRLIDVGDMLEHYNAQGFGVMTSAPIDATLYDKLDAICSKCKIEQINFSVLESERALYYDDILRCRYFGK